MSVKLNLEFESAPDLVIVQEGHSLSVYQNGYIEKGVTGIEYTNSLEEAPYLNISKYVLPKGGVMNDQQG